MKVKKTVSGAGPISARVTHHDIVAQPISCAEVWSSNNYQVTKGFSTAFGIV